MNSLRKSRFLLVVLAIGFALAVALLRPLPGRAGGGAPGTGDAVPTSIEEPPVPPPVPGVDTPAPVRRLASSRHAQQGVALGQRVVRYAKHLLGVPYEWGGTSPRTGFDCSGLVRYVYSHFGVSLPHSSFADFWRGRHVGRWQMKPGDLVFFDGAGHVGIYVGRGRFIHAPPSGTVVTISTMSGWYGAEFVGARRIR